MPADNPPVKLKVILDDGTTFSIDPPDTTKQAVLQLDDVAQKGVYNPATKTFYPARTIKSIQIVPV